MSEFTYTFLSVDDRVLLLKERLHQLEAEHYKLTTEVRLASVIGQDGVTSGAMVQLAAMEVQAVALCEWITTEGRERAQTS